MSDPDNALLKGGFAAPVPAEAATWFREGVFFVPERLGVFFAAGLRDAGFFELLAVVFLAVFLEDVFREAVFFAVRFREAVFFAAGFRFVPVALLLALVAAVFRDFWAVVFFAVVLRAPPRDVFLDDALDEPEPRADDFRAGLMGAGR